MKFYNAYFSRDKKNKIDDVVVIKEGFSLTALILGPLWFLYHKMWQEFFTLILLKMAISIMGNFLPTFDRLVMEIIVMFLVALNANYWYAQSLLKKDYKFLTIIGGLNKDDALFNVAKQHQTTTFRDGRSFAQDLLNPRHADYFAFRFFRMFRRKKTA